MSAEFDGFVPWQPVPTVAINSAPIAPAPPGGDLSGLVALAGLRCTWGTDQPLDQPDPATASVSLLDFTRTWATSTDVIGLPVDLSWTTTFPFTRVFFRGRITGVDLDRVNVQRPDGTTVPATRVDLTCSSIEVDLANRFPTETSWPAESIGARAARIAAYCTGVATSVNIRAFWATTPQAAAVPDVNRTSIRDLLLQLYNSCGGDRMVYSPDKQTYEYLVRAQSSNRTLQRLQIGVGGHPRENLGAWIAPDVNFTATGVDNTTAPNLYIDSTHLEYDEGLSRQASQRITRVSVTSKDAAAADAQVTSVAVDANANEAIIGQRTVTFDSLHNFNSWAALNASDLLAMATQEGAAWRPSRIRWDTRRSGGFPLHANVNTLLRGHQVGYAVAINGSWFPAYGIRPVFRITGAVITYEGGPTPGWVVEFDVAGFSTWTTTPPTLQHAITFEEVDDGTTANTVCWYDDDNPHGIHQSVTFEDCGYVGRGVGATTIGPDTGWDRP